MLEQEQYELHKDLTWKEFLMLPESEKDNNTIYFITDKQSQIEIVSELVEAMTYVQSRIKDL